MIFVIIGVCAAIALGIVIGVFFFGKSRKDAALMQKVARFRQEIKSDGISATATVVSIHHMETTMGGNTCFDWVLSVELPDGATYEVSEDQLECEKCFYLNEAYSSYAGKTGAVIPVTVHPRHRELIQIDEERLHKLAQAE